MLGTANFFDNFLTRYRPREEHRELIEDASHVSSKSDPLICLLNNLFSPLNHRKLVEENWARVALSRRFTYFFLPFKL